MSRKPKKFRIYENPEGLFTVQVKGLFGWKAAEQMYGSFDCSWDITHDTIEAARRQLNRIEREVQFIPKVHEERWIY